MRDRIDITIDSKVLKNYKKLCIDLDDTPSYRIENLMKKELKNHSLNDILKNKKRRN